MATNQPSKSDSILLAIDGSMSAKGAALAATQIASVMQWSLHAVYVVDSTEAFDLYSDIVPELGELRNDVPDERKITLFEEQGTLALAEIIGMCQRVNVPITTEMVMGNTQNIILDSANQYNLLALGRRGNRHETDTQHLGSNFRHIAHHVTIPILIGGNYNPQQEFRHGLLAYDGGELSRQALTWIESLQVMFAEVMVLSIEKEHETEHAWLEERKNEIAGSVLAHAEFISAEGEPGKIIASTALSRQVNLILMGAYQHGEFLEWATNSAIDVVLREINLPILAAK